MHTFTQLLEAEANSSGTEITKQRNTEHRLVVLNTEIKRIVSDLDLAQNQDPNNHRSYTMFDLSLALDAVEAVIHSRLTGTPDEYQNDAKRNYSSLWTSIEEEVRDAIETLFIVRSDKEKKRLLFVHDFNRLVITRFITALSLIGPEQSKNILPIMIKSTKNVIASNTVEYSDDSRNEALLSLRKYSVAHTKKVAKANRLTVIRNVVRNIEAEAAA